ncbi:MAG: glycosyltransferase [Candidatus Omnitrophica bacterium]|nr:glycosyltransferase [Candidatus Omnitrophota bacterium]
MPETSIVTPTYNRAQLIPRLMESVFQQTYQDFEIIIVDDGSTDETEQAVAEYVKNDPNRVRYVRQSNQGSGAARNTGVDHARGKYVAFLDSDDVWRPEYLERTVGALKMGRYHWAVTGAERIDIDADGKETGRSIIRCDLQQKRDYFGRELSVFEGLLTGNVLGETSRVVVTKLALQVVGGFRPDLKLSQDYELWLRLARENYFLCIIEDPLVTYQKSVDSVTKTRFIEGLKFGYRIINQYCREAVQRDPLFAKFYADKMWIYARDVYHSRPFDPLFLIRCMINSYRFRWMYKLRKKEHEKS